MGCFIDFSVLKKRRNSFDVANKSDFNFMHVTHVQEHANSGKQPFMLENLKKRLRCNLKD